MHCPHCALYSLWHQSGCSTVPLPSLATDLSNNTTRQRSSPHATGLSVRFEKDEDASYQQGSRHQSKDGFLLVIQAAQASPACPSQTEACSFIEIDELCTSIAKKNSQCWLWLAIDSIFGKVLGFVFGRRTIKTGNVSWQQIKHLPTMDYGTDLLKAYENFIPHAKHYTGKTFTTK
ncbi:MAG: hypothetical protein CL921_05675 [Deltaproteobacteria bacterium]|nr:hypothetical protein [Deltaproteobacteria bacterium]